MGFAKSYTDMLGRRILIQKPVRRIVSLVPSQTELLYTLGMHDRIAGQTIFCVHPEDRFKHAVKVGGTKKLRFDQIDALEPDLIICNKEENNRSDVEQLSLKYPVWVSDVSHVSDACTMIDMLGDILDAEDKAQALSNKIRTSMQQIRVIRRYTCLYLIWRKPYMMAGQGTFINHMIELAGFSNLCSAPRYPEIGEHELKTLNPRVLLLSSEPYPFNDAHIAELAKLLPDTHIILVDGELFSWYGSRLLNSQAYFNDLQKRLHRDIQ